MHVDGDNKKKVVLLANIWQRIGGLESVNMDIAHAFKSNGWQVEVLSVYGTNDDHGSSDYKIVSLCPKNRYFRYLWNRLFWKIVVSWYVRRNLADGDLLIFGHAHLLPVLSYFPLKSKFKKLIWVHGIEVWGSQAIRWIPFLNKLDQIVAVSSFTALQIKHAGLLRPVSIIPNSVDTNLFTPSNTPEKIRRTEVLICGRMAKSEGYKGHRILFESIPIAEAILGRQIRVRVIGTGDDQQHLKEFVKQIGITDRVIFTGRVSEKELLEAYQHCGVFCMPSYVTRPKKEYWTGEGFGIVYIEASACGRPVIASKDGGASETIISGITGLLVDPLSPADVAKAIAEIISDTVRADEMGKQGRLLTESRFSKDKFRLNVNELTLNIAIKAKITY